MPPSIGYLARWDSRLLRNRSAALLLSNPLENLFRCGTCGARQSIHRILYISRGGQGFKSLAAHPLTTRIYPRPSFGPSEDGLPTIKRELEIGAPPEKIWDIISDPANLHRLAPYVVSIDLNPPGPYVKGAKGHAIGKIPGRTVEVYAEVAEAEPNKKLALRQRPGGILKLLSSSLTLEPTKKGTLVREEFQFEVAMGALGKALGGLLVERSIKKNAEEYLENLKEMVEGPEAAEAA